MATLNFIEESADVISSTVTKETTSNLDTCTIEAPFNYSVNIGDELNLYDGNSTLLFKGLVQNIKISGRKEIVAYDYGVQLMDININEIYTNEKAEDIIEDIITTKTDLTFVSTINSSLAINSFPIKDKRGWDVVNELAELINASFRVDKNKNFYLELVEEDTSTETISSDNASIDGDWNQVADQLVNKVTIIGDKQTFEKIETFSGNASETEFALAEFPVDVYVTVGGVEKTGYVEGASTEADYKIDKATKKIIFTAGSTPASGTDNISVTYTFSIDIKLVSQDNVSIETYGGTSKIPKEKKIVKPYITSFQEARNYANYYLSNYSQPLLSSTWIINDYSKFENFVPNQRISVTDSIRNISGFYVIKKIEREFPGMLKVEIGWQEDTILDWSKEVQYRIKQLEEIDDNSNILQEYSYIQNDVQLQVTTEVSRKLERTLPDNYLYYGNPISGLQGWWKLNGNTFDSSGNNNDGTFTGFDGEVGWWQGNGDALDSSDGGNNGTWTGTELYATGKQFLEMFDFDGSSRVNITGASFGSGASKFAFSCWINSDGTQPVGGNNYVFRSSNDAIGMNINSTGDSVGIVIQENDGSYLSAATTIIPGTNHFIYGEYDSTNSLMSIYLDNVFVTSTAVNDVIKIGSYTLYLGYEGSSARYYDGKLGDLRFYDRVLTDNERTRIYNEGLGLTTALTPYDEGKQFAEAVDIVTTTSDNIVIDDLDYLFTQLGTYTISCWIKRNSSGTNANIWNFGGNGSNRHNLNWNNGILGFQRYDGSSYTGIKLDNFNTNDIWYHIICENDAGTLKLYIDNIESGYSGFQYAVTDGSDNFYIGYPNIGINGSQGLHGQIGDVRIYNRVLSTDERTSIYNSGLGLTSNTNIQEIANGEDRVLGYPILGLQGWWKLNGNTVDSSGNSNTGVWSGTEAYAMGKQFDLAADFDGINSYVDLDTSVKDVLSVSNDYTICFWFKANTLTGNLFLGSAINYLNRMSIIYYSGTIRTSAYDGSWHSDYISFSDTTNYHHLIMINNGGTITGYLDGVSMGHSDSSVSGSTSAIAKTFIGARQDGVQFWDGYIGDVRIYNRILNSSEITSIYNSGLGSNSNTYNKLSDGSTGTVYTFGDENVWNRNPDNELSTQIAQYLLDGDTTDNVGSYDGTAIDVSYGTGKMGQAASFNGSTSYIYVTTNDFKTSSSTWMCWFKADNLVGYLIGYGTSTSDRFLFGFSSTTLKIHDDIVNEGQTVDGTTTLSTGTWYHAAVTISSDGTKRVYLNGEPEIYDSDGSNLTGLADGSVFYIGSQIAGANNFDGLIDDVRVFNSDLTIEQIKSIYELESNDKYASWKNIQ